MNKSEAIQEFKNEIPDICDEKFAELSDSAKQLSRFIKQYKKICVKLDDAVGYDKRRMLQLWALQNEKNKLLQELSGFFFLKNTLDMPENDIKLSIQEFKERHPMLETAKEYLELNYQNMALCPFHKDTQRSLKIYDDHFYCFGCNFGGDVIDFLKRWYNTDVKSILERKYYASHNQKNMH
jgi:hypothetical protein